MLSLLFKAWRRAAPGVSALVAICWFGAESAPAQTVLSQAPVLHAQAPIWHPQGAPATWNRYSAYTASNGYAASTGYPASAGYQANTVGYAPLPPIQPAYAPAPPLVTSQPIATSQPLMTPPALLSAQATTVQYAQPLNGWTPLPGSVRLTGETAPITPIDGGVRYYTPADTAPQLTPVAPLTAAPQYAPLASVGGACPCQPTAFAPVASAPLMNVSASYPVGGACAPRYPYHTVGYAAAPATQYAPLLPLGQNPYSAYLGRGILGQPKAYMPGQPVRNFFRYLTP